MGNEVTVYCGDRPLSSGVTEEGKIRIVRMRVPLSFYGTPLASFPPSFASGDFDVVHCNFPNPYFAAISATLCRVRGVPAVLTWHNDLPAVTKVSSVLVGLNGLASNVYLAPYARIIATTEIYARNSRILRRERRKVEVIPNGVDTTRFHPAVDGEHLKERYHLGHCKVLIFVGALTTWHTYKGLDNLLLAFRLVKGDCDRLHLLVVGGGNLLGHYQMQARRLGIGDRVVFTGTVEEVELPACYAASDFAVVPSINSSEGYGLVALEAMATGKTVVGSAVGGLPDLIESGKTGLLALPGDTQSLAEAIRRLYSDEELVRRMGREARQFATTRDWLKTTDQTLSLYRRILLRNYR